MGKYLSLDGLKTFKEKADATYVKAAAFNDLGLALLNMDDSLVSAVSPLFTGDGIVLKIKAGTNCLYITNNTDTDKWYRRNKYTTLNHNYKAQNVLGVAYISGFSNNLSQAFYNCTSLTILELSYLDTSAVTNMELMFGDCSSLTSINLSKFDTAAVTNMRGMFNGCSSLTSINLSKFDTAAVTNMIQMFYGCTSLTSIDLSKFDTAAVTEIWEMFYGCTSLKSIDGSSLVKSKVTNMSFLFYGCSSLSSLSVKYWDTSNVISMANMFYQCSSLRYITLGANFFNTTQAIPFDGAENLGLKEDGTDNGWLAHLAETAPTITDGMARTIQLPSALKALSTSATYITTLTEKGYTVA